MYKRLLWIIGIILVFGLIMLASAGVVDGQKKFGDPYYYVKHQLLFGVLPGLVALFIFSKIDYRIWRKLSFFILFLSLALMILVFVPGVGLKLKGAQSWIAVLGHAFQPAEFLKLGLVVYFAAWFGGRDDRVKNWAYGVVPFFMVVGFVGLLLMLQPDLGTLAIIVAIALGVYFVAGVKLKDLALLGLIGFVAFSALIAIEPYRLNRVKTLLNPTADPQGFSYQVNQSMIAIGSGGLFGVGYGHSKQKFGFLPETIGDSIFAVIAEELGLVGALATLGMFVMLAVTLAQISQNTPDMFGKLFTMGINSWVMAQALVNIAAIAGVGPLTGIPLPLISYGGTALIGLMAALGIVLNISKRV